MTTRDTIRTQILSGKHEAETKLLELFGSEVEIKQLTLKGVLAYQKKLEEDTSEALVDLLLDFCFVPGTDELVFEAGDRESIMKMPFNGKVMNFVNEVNGLMGFDVEVEAGNSDAITDS